MQDKTYLFAELSRAIQRADRILLIAHKSPDGDTLGASCGMLNWLIREGKNVSAFCLDAPPKNLVYLDNVHRFSNDPATFDVPYDLVIVFDAGDLEFCGIADLVQRIPSEYVLWNLDHHATNKRYGTGNIVLTDASSTAEVVFRFLESQNIRIDSAIATCLLTGLCTDTSNFSNAATHSFAMAVASQLVAAGGRFQDILKYLWRNQSIEGLKLWGVMLERLQYNPTYDLATSYLKLEDLERASSEDIAGMTNFLNATLGSAEAMLILTEQPNGTVRGSMRSLRRDISTFARALGGGGHKKAAGFTVNGKIEVQPDGSPRIVPVN